MTVLEFLAQWALRSSILILCGALLLRLLRVKDPAVRLAAYAAILCGSLMLPALTAALPKLPLIAMRAQPAPIESPATKMPAAPPGNAPEPSSAPPPARFDWRRAAEAIYVAVACSMLLRLCTGLAAAHRLVRNSRPTGRTCEAIEIRESEQVHAPATLGILRPVILLPPDWREWNAARLDAVLAHEHSHIARRDPAVQLLSALHRALLWHSPASWFLHSRLVRVAEEASDDAAVMATRDRALYAEVLLEFVRRAGDPDAHWAGVPMARYNRPEERIQRILDGSVLSRGVSRAGVAAIVAAAVPLTCLLAAATKAAPPQPPTRAVATAESPAQRETPAEAPPPQAAPPAASSDFLDVIGNIAPYHSVTIRPRIDGELRSVNIKEGDTVQEAQLLATIDPQPWQVQLERAQGRLAEDQAALNRARLDLERSNQLVASGAIPKDASARALLGMPQLEAQRAEVAQAEARVSTALASLDAAKLELSYTEIRAPISGVVGLRRVDPGNIVRASDPDGILVINQLQPAAVVFQIPEDQLPRVRGRLAAGASLPVEVWNRAHTAKIGTGRVTAIDNQIDPTTGTAKLKAVLDNQNGALFANQFVNVRLFLSPR